MRVRRLGVVLVVLACLLAAAAALVSGSDGRAMLARIALGFVLAGAGSTALLTAATYWRPNGLTLLAFGLFSLLYGVRILISLPPLASLLDVSRRSLFFAIATCNYLLPVAGLFYAERVRGPGWFGLLRWTWRVGLVLAAAFIAYDQVAGMPWASLPVYRVYIVGAMIVLLPHVIFWRQPDPVESAVRTAGTLILALTVLHDILLAYRLLPWRVPLEAYGIGAFVLGLGFVTARGSVRDQRELAAVERELATARAIQTAILPRRLPLVQGLDLAVRFVPVRSVAGDVYDFMAIEGRRLGLLVADVSGHGVPAAMIGSMAAVAFASQQAHASAPGRVLEGMNTALGGRIDERQFVTAACAFVDAGARLVRYSLAGHPPPLLWRKRTGAIVELSEGGTVIGFSRHTCFPVGEERLEPGDRLLFYTDGLIEVPNGPAEWFGDRELRRFLSANGDLGAEAFAEALVDDLGRWSGRGGGAALDDDLTVIVVDLLEERR